MGRILSAKMFLPVTKVIEGKGRRKEEMQKEGRYTRREAQGNTTGRGWFSVDPKQTLPSKKKTRI